MKCIHLYIIFFATTSRREMSIKKEIVVKLINETGLSSRSFAIKHHINPETLRLWLSGQRNCKFGNIIKLAQSIGCSVSEIFDGKMTFEMFRTAVLATEDPSMMQEAYQKKLYPEKDLNALSEELASQINSYDFEEAPSPYRKKLREVRLVPPVELEKEIQLPVVSLAAAAEVNTAIYPIADWAENNAIDRQSFRLGRPGDIVLEVDGESMLPWYPPHTRLLCRPCRPKTGDRVVAVLKDGETIFKVYVEGRKRFGFRSINQKEGLDYKFEKTDFTAVRSIYTVIESARDERALDKAMSESGIHHFWQKDIDELDK